MCNRAPEIFRVRHSNLIACAVVRQMKRVQLQQQHSYIWAAVQLTHISKWDCQPRENVWPKINTFYNNCEAKLSSINSSLSLYTFQHREGSNVAAVKASRFEPLSCKVRDLHYWPNKELILHANLISSATHARRCVLSHGRVTAAD